jgi:phage/plasmid-associated DNA primase
MSIQNQLSSSIAGVDLRSLMIAYGPPNYPTKRNPVGTINENFWAAFFATCNEILYENRESEFYQYDGKIYNPFSTHLLLDQLGNDLMFAAQNWPDYGPLAQLRNVRHLNGCVAQLKGKVQQEGVFEQRRKYIHVANGVIDLTHNPPKLVPFSPRLVSRNLIPVQYRPGAKCKRFLTELLKPLSGDDVVVFQKLLGMFLGGHNFLHAILILEGVARSGKSALAAVIRQLVGEHNCGELRTSQLHERFELSRYMRKILLIGADVAGDFLNQRGAHKLKGMTGGDFLEVEWKFSNKVCLILGIFNILITCNSRLTVKIDGDRSAWARRLIILPYKERMHQKDIPDFAYQLVQEEGSGILNLGLEGLELLNRDIKNHGAIELSAEQRQRTEALLDESEGLRYFVTRQIVTDPTEDLSSQEIIEKYAAYCAEPEHGWNFNTRKVERQLPDLMMQLFQTAQSHSISRGLPSKNVRGYRNVTFRP